MDSLKKLQAGSGLAFGAFLIIHLVCHYSLNVSFEAAEQAKLMLRPIYQNVVFEIGLLIAILTHYYANTKIFLKRSKLSKSGKKKKNDGEGNDKKKTSTTGTLELQGHRIAGYILSLLVLGHVIATRIGPIGILDDPAIYGYDFILYALDLFPFPAFDAYLVLLGVAGGWHLIYGTRAAVSTLTGGSVVGRPFPLALKVLAMASHISLLFAVIHLRGYHKTVDISKNIDTVKYYFETMGV